MTTERPLADAADALDGGLRLQVAPIGLERHAIEWFEPNVAPAKSDGLRATQSDLSVLR